MSKGAKVAFWAWTIFIVVVAGLLLRFSLETRTYDGEEIAFQARQGWYLDVDSSESVRIEAADNQYFRIVKGDVHLYGIPKQPPLDYEDEEYFRLDEELPRGRWRVVEGGTVSIRLEGEQPFRVTYFPSGSTIGRDVVLGAVLAILFWLIGWLLGSAFFYD